MIFTPKHIQQIIDGIKTQARRIVKPGERFVYAEDSGEHFILTPGERVKWRVGQDYAVVPKCGKPGSWYRLNDYDQRRSYQLELTSNPDYDVDAKYILATQTGDKMYGSTQAQYMELYPDDWHRCLAKIGFKALRIKILSLHYPKPLQAIGGTDAIAEGVANVAEYRDLWESINGPCSWNDNPNVWVIKFEVLAAIKDI